MLGMYVHRCHPPEEYHHSFRYAIKYVGGKTNVVIDAVAQKHKEWRPHLAK
jgi:hypothetical protein